MLQDNKKNESAISQESSVFFCLKLCRLLELSKGISLDFKFRCYGNQNQNYCLLLKKRKVYCLSNKSDVHKVILKQYSLIVTAGSVNL